MREARDTKSAPAALDKIPLIDGGSELAYGQHQSEVEPDLRADRQAVRREACHRGRRSEAIVRPVRDAQNEHTVPDRDHISRHDRV